MAAQKRKRKRNREELDENQNNSNGPSTKAMRLNNNSRLDMSECTETQICGIFAHRKNPDTSSPFIYQYQVQRTKQTQIQWESMEQILNTNLAYPMTEHCDELISEYHQYIMQFAADTAINIANKSKKQLIFTPTFDVECILDEKQECGDGDIQFKIRWKNWPSVYDCWVGAEGLAPGTFVLVNEFRRLNGKKSLGSKGFHNPYWKEIYPRLWKPYMDGVDNGIEHANCVHSFFRKFGFDITHIADFGFGRGGLLDAFVKKFKPKIAYGLEPSKCAFEAYCSGFIEKLKTSKSHFNKSHVHLECIDLLEFFERESWSMEQVELYNKRYKANKKKKGKKLKNVKNVDMDNEDNEDTEGDEKEISKEFCYCGKNSKYFERKLKKYNKNKKNGDLYAAFDHFPCECCKNFRGPFELGLCVSVVQYLADKDVDTVFRLLSEQCDFLYFDVVTEEDYEIMANGGSQFKDKWAIRRPRKWYFHIIFKYWRMISHNTLESKRYFPQNKDSNIPNTICMIDESIFD